MLDIRVCSRVEDVRITLGFEERAGNGGNLADEVWMNVVREEPSSHDMKLLTDSQDGVGHVLLLELSLPLNGSRFSAAAAPRASEYQSGGRRASISEPAAAGGATRHGNQRGAAGSCNRVGRQPRPRALLRV